MRNVFGRIETLILLVAAALLLGAGPKGFAESAAHESPEQLMNRIQHDPRYEVRQKATDKLEEMARKDRGVLAQVRAAVADKKNTELQGRAQGIVNRVEPQLSYDEISEKLAAAIMESPIVTETRDAFDKIFEGLNPVELFRLHKAKRKVESANAALRLLGDWIEGAGRVLTPAETEKFKKEIERWLNVRDQALGSIVSILDTAAGNSGFFVNSTRKVLELPRQNPLNPQGPSHVAVVQLAIFKEGRWFRIETNSGDELLLTAINEKTGRPKSVVVAPGKVMPSRSLYPTGEPASTRVPPAVIEVSLSGHVSQPFHYGTEIWSADFRRAFLDPKQYAQQYWQHLALNHSAEKGRAVDEEMREPDEPWIVSNRHKDSPFKRALSLFLR